MLARRKTELILFYYNELVDTLRKMGYLSAPPTLLELQMELLQNGFLGEFDENSFVLIFIII